MLDHTIVKIQTEQPVKAHGNSLRGYIADNFPQYDILHNHKKDGKLLYLYPRVQYKILNGEAYIIGLEEGVEIVREIEPQIETIIVKYETYQVKRKQSIFEKIRFGPENYFIKYLFLKPWLALNEDNYDHFMGLKKTTLKDSLLKKILIGNILSMSKSLGFIVEQEIKIKSINFREKKVFLKGTPMLGFLGTFSVNFEIPDYWGIGKSVSRGFGTVKRVQG
ncbi:MAG: CRISPR-associated endonuclease Cas6 [Thermodesulfobacteriota bacterium]|nr:CRISPR-associated endonuclease Cas6 [Thermodesulfobacteriota bacterium]